MNNKTHIKVCILRNKNSPFTKFNKLRQYNFNRWCIFYRIISYMGQFLNMLRYRHTRIDKFRKSIDNLSIFYFDSTNLRELIFLSPKSCCLDIKNNQHIIKGTIIQMITYRFLIINQISFNTIEHLYIVIVYTMKGICISLYYTVIGNSYGFVSPCNRLINTVFDTHHPIHITHLRM